jgi:hypothetical protein
MKKEVLKICLFSILMMTIVNLSMAYSATIRLKNGTIIGGERIFFDDASLIIKEPVPGIARKISLPSFSNKTFLKTFQPEFISEWKEKGRISLYISGGASHINGGDLNGMIKGYNEFIRDLNDHYQTDYSIDWKEFGWIQNFKAEVLLNLSNSFSLGLGVEYLAKTRKGTIIQNDADSGTYIDTLYYYNYSLEDNISSWPQPKLIVIPVTCDLYFFIPLGNKADVFLKGGVGYYFGKVKYNESYLQDYKYKADYYGNDGTFWYSWIDNGTENDTWNYEAKCKELGYQAGIGLDIKLSSLVSLVVEANYRYVNLKDWSGNGSESLSWTEESGRSDLGITTENGNKSDSWDGKIWYYELYIPDLNKQYKHIFLHEEAYKEGEWIQGAEIRNVRQAEINLNGFSLRAGIKITF